MNEIALDNPHRRMLLEPQFARSESALAPLHHVIGAIRSRWRLALLVGIAILAAVLAVGLSMPRHYAEAMLVIHPVSENLARPGNGQTDQLPDSSAVDTEVEILRSPAIAEAVVKKLKLYNDPEFGGSPSDGPTENMLRKVVPAVMSRTHIRRIGLTYAVQVGFMAHSMDEAERVANGIVAAYIAMKMDQKLAAISRANHELGAALAGLRNQALTAESRVQEYISRNGLFNTDGTSISEAELSALNQRIADAQADSAEKQARVAAALSQAQQGSGGSDVGATLASNTIGALRQKEADVSATVAQLQTQFRPDYPELQKSQAELRDIRKQLQSETNRILSSLKADADAAGRREASLIASRQQVENTIAANNRARVGLLALRQAADSSKTIYDTYLKRASEVTAERGLQQVDATVESNAVPGTAGGFTSLRFIALGGFILALIGSVLTVLLVDMWTPRVRSHGDVFRETGLSLAGVIPDVTALDRVDNAANHIVSKPLTAVAEAYRGLTAYLSVTTQPGRNKVIAATSAVPGEGKTLLSICLARTLAAGGARVVLLDCDLRRASASRFFGKPRYGIADVLLRSVEVERALVRDGLSGLWFLSATATNDVQNDLFGSGRLEALLEKLSKEFDHIIIDTPPLLGAADARILASKADRVLYLVEWNKTPASVVRAASEILRQCKARVAGVVLNRVNLRQQAYYGFADGSDYYYRYGSMYLQKT